ncbi:MAG: TatD family hydrolase, partial [Elusimicrobiales bacterium]|nr:TatD family hydrolase [Elusimicrobiales bacterium]
MAGLFDAHNHFQEFPDPVLAAAGLRPAFCCSTGPADWAAVKAFAAAAPGAVPFFGLHPWLIKEAGRNWLAPLETLIKETRSGVGECGLDALKGPPVEDQREVLAAQLGLAVLLDRPVSLHCVRAWGPLLDCLRTAGPLRFLVHSYSASAEITRELAALGGYFSFGPALLDARRTRARAALGFVPRDRLLFESEAPRPAGAPAALLARRARAP